jgi:DNA (cytosine-5)-methyltransferase 1
MTGDEQALLVPVAHSATGNGCWREGLGTLASRDYKDGTSAGLVTVPVDLQNCAFGRTGLAGTLDTTRPSRGGGQAVLAFDTTQITSAANYSRPEPGDPCHPLAAKAHAPSVATPMMVRRLTPVECARLQGFPDDYLDITYRGRPAADGNKYRALGNSFCVPVVRWIGERIALVERLVDADAR